MKKLKIEQEKAIQLAENAMDKAKLLLSEEQTNAKKDMIQQIL